MFTKNVNAAENSPIPERRGPGRPPGRTPQGLAAKQRLYDIAMELITERGYETTTLRDVADRAGVSVGLLYRYFPSKRTVVLQLYDELSARYAERAAGMAPGRWRERFLFALETSLDVLRPHRRTLAALTPILVGDANEGVFSTMMAPSRQRVQIVFHDAVAGATDAPRPPIARALGQLLYVAHLAIILWWLLDRSRHQRATTALVALVRQSLPVWALTLRLKHVRSFVLAAEGLVREALLGDRDSVVA
ncbi:MAG TPA: helix-turn-helix domain-containing protein [Vicinamibacterales bacterium]|jgi:AcrR family transcriptional regulator